ncbi:ATP-grasp domain-containing protein [Nonomuraea deserti]|uniref:ATP-grasp domain-containing protein n=1 Tax=Nonomuraea deserti TaxID=1848322 RepID=A0A4R4VXY6_9ACTN|nr:peptide ligase PGM1-related protein [Nonomuraea deserti]TDD07754.1 ATP-grasp domain-containing protein [Nonomuraea deserti]
MTTLYVGNSYNETLVGDLSQFDPEERRIGGNLSCRLVWLMDPGDLLVSPQPISDEFLGYASRLKGVPITSADVVIPPPGGFGEDVLTADRLREGRFVDELRAMIAGRGLDRIVPYCYDQIIASLARDVGIGSHDASAAFCEAGGVDLINRKSVFRALCGGAGVPVADGLVTRSVSEATDFVTSFIEAGQSVIVKQDAHQGGHGNEILTPSADTVQLGAAVLTVVADRHAVEERLGEQWPRFSSNSRDPVVIEHYLENAISLGCEVSLAGESAVMRHTVEMRMTPVFDGFLIPPSLISEECNAEFSRYSLELANVVHAMGYRGYINIDGLAADDGKVVVLNEFNGRLGASTHLHWIGRALIGDDYLRRRYLISNNDLKVDSFSSAAEALERAGLAFDPERGEGVILTCDHTAQSGAVEYCAVGTDVATAADYERRLHLLSTSRRQHP